MAYKLSKRCARALAMLVASVAMLSAASAHAAFIEGGVSGCVFNPLGCPAPDGGLFDSSVGTIGVPPEAGISEFSGSPELVGDVSADFQSIDPDGFSRLVLMVTPAFGLPELGWTFGGLTTTTGDVLSAVEFVSAIGLPFIDAMLSGPDSIVVNTGPVTGPGSVTLLLRTVPGGDTVGVPAPAPLLLVLAGALLFARRR